MYFYAIHPDLLAEFCRFCISLDIIPDLFYRKLSRFILRCPYHLFSLIRRNHHLIEMQDRICQCLQRFIPGDLQHLCCERIISSCKSGSKLEENLRTVCMDLLHDRTCLLKHFRTFMQPFSHDHGINGDHSRNKKSHIIFCPFYVIIMAFFVKFRTCHIVHNVRALHSRNDHSVFDLARSDPEWSK